jgi:hypothetical protein
VAKLAKVLTRTVEPLMMMMMMTTTKTISHVVASFRRPVVVGGLCGLGYLNLYARTGLRDGKLYMHLYLAFLAKPCTCS